GLWTVGALANGATATLALGATVASGSGGGVLTDSARISGADQADHTPANDAVSASVTIPIADLGLAIVVDRPAPNEGETIAFSITLTNHGPDPASGIAVTDLLPSGSTFVSATPGTGSYSSAGG